jgi:hypothetical protein
MHLGERFRYPSSGRNFWEIGYLPHITALPPIGAPEGYLLQELVHLHGRFLRRRGKTTGHTSLEAWREDLITELIPTGLRIVDRDYGPAIARGSGGVKNLSLG